MTLKDLIKLCNDPNYEIIVDGKRVSDVTIVDSTNQILITSPNHKLRLYSED